MNMSVFLLNTPRKLGNTVTIDSTANTPTVVWQSVITKDIFLSDLPNLEFNRAADIRTVNLSTPLVFCSLQNARIIERIKMPIHTGLFYPEKFLHYTEYSSYVNQKYLLNPDYIVLPWHKIIQNLDMIVDLYGDNIFIRPNSPIKPFTGFSKIGVSDLTFELNALSQTERVRPSELCVITSGKTISNVEWRFWAVDGKISTFAPYGWNDDQLSKTSIDDIPDQMADAVEQIANSLIEHENALVIDMVMYEDQPKLVELNAVSTSGWYKGMDYHALISDLKDLYI